MVKYKVGGVTSLSGITFAGLNHKVTVRDSDGAFMVRKYSNPSKHKLSNVPFIRGFLKLYNAFKMVSGTIIGKISFGLFGFSFLMFLIGLFKDESVSSAVVQSSSIINNIFSIITFVIVIAFLLYISSIRSLHGLEHKIIETYNNDLELTISNVIAQKKESPQCGGTYLGILFLIDVFWVFLLGLPSLFVWLLWPSIGYEAFLITRGNKWYNKILFFPGYLIQKITTGDDVSYKTVLKYVDGFKAFIAQEDPEYYNKHY